MSRGLRESRFWGFFEDKFNLFLSGLHALRKMLMLGRLGWRGLVLIFSLFHFGFIIVTFITLAR